MLLISVNPTFRREQSQYFSLNVFMQSNLISVCYYCFFLYSSVEGGEPESEVNPALAFQRAFVEEGNFEFVSQLHVVSLLPLRHSQPSPRARKQRPSSRQPAALANLPDPVRASAVFLILLLFSLRPTQRK